MFLCAGRGLVRGYAKTQTELGGRERREAKTNRRQAEWRASLLELVRGAKEEDEVKVSRAVCLQTATRRLLYRFRRSDVARKLFGVFAMPESIEGRARAYGVLFCY